MKQKILLLSFLFLSLIGYAQPIDWNKKLPADPNGCVRPQHDP